MKLSILVCSTHTRYNSFLQNILDQLFGQWNKLNDTEKKEVEILSLIDNKSIILGEKRNWLINIAQGRYIAFVDDDDRVSDDYMVSLLHGINSNADVITFTVSVSLNGNARKPCFYSRKFEKDRNFPDRYERLPNHLMCARSELAAQVLFPSIVFGEDSDYAIRLKPLLKTEFAINKTLYFYDYNDSTTETRNHSGSTAKETALCDVVILSNAKTEKLKTITQRCIHTLLISEKPGTFNITVIEQTDIAWKKVRTMRNSGEFNYNKFANSVIRQGNSPWICVANNDLVFTRYWFTEMMKTGADVMSPKDPGNRKQRQITHVEGGYEVGRHFSGWCFVMKRSVWDAIGSLDEDFPFWCADNATVEQIKRLGIIPMLIPSSVVQHLGSSTLKTVPAEAYDEMTRLQVKKFNRKYNQNLFNLGI